jgi:hypothetical protein
MTTSIAKILILLSISAACWAQPPAHVRINGNRWTIKHFDRATDFPDLDGYTNCSSHTIYYRGPRNQDLQWIMWHEFLHAGACFGPEYDGHYWDNPDIKKHEGIYRLTAYLHELMRDNPELARWLIGGN